MGAEWQEGKLSAWLRKKKSGSALVRVREYNKRYFTIDFDSRVFFYAQTESSKKVSTVIPFSDILDVRASESPDKAMSDTLSETSKSSRVSFIRRLSKNSLGDPQETDEHRVTILTRPARSMELVCASAEEATKWFEAFTAAIAAGGNNGGSSPVLTGGGDSPDAGKGGYPSAAGQPPIADSGYPSAAGQLPIAPVSALAAAEGAAEDSSAPRTAALAPAEQDEEEEAGAPPPARATAGSFLDFNTELEQEPVSHGAESSQQVAESCEEVQQLDVTVLSTPSKANMAADFGFDEMDEDRDDSDSDASVAGDRGRGSLEGADGVEAVAVASADATDVLAGPSDTSPAPRAAPLEKHSYEDRNAGKTMAERLANLEFSDDEDDDDDPLGLNKKNEGDG